MWYRWKPEPDGSKALETNRENAIEREAISTSPSDVEASEKRKLDNDDNESVASFRRVRMLSKPRIHWLLKKGDIVDSVWGKIFFSAWTQPNATISPIVRAPFLYNYTIDDGVKGIPSDIRKITWK